MEKEKFEVGCYFDGAFGFYNNAVRIVAFAEGLGWNSPFTFEFPDSASDLSDDNHQWLVETIDEIEEWITDNTIHEENESWCWSDGDFGLWAHCEECGEFINKGEGCIIC